MLELFFLLFGVFLIGGGLLAVLARDPALYATGFFAVMLALAGFFALLDESFLFLAQVLVSVGAVVVVTLIVVLTVNLKEERIPPEPFRWLWAAGAATVVAPFGWMLYRALVAAAGRFAPAGEGFGSVSAVGSTLFSEWVLPFELLSLLLLAALVGALVIGKKEQTYDIDS